MSYMLLFHLISSFLTMKIRIQSVSGNKKRKRVIVDSSSSTSPIRLDNESTNTQLINVQNKYNNLTSAVILQKENLDRLTNIRINYY
jgi:hypothetical protein